MKGIIAVLAVMLALVSVGAAWPCEPVCGTNTIVQSNVADASGKDSQDITQTQQNCAMILGDNNYINQANDAKVVSGSNFKTVTQTQSNVAMLVGKSNTAYQSNTAVSDCAPQSVLEQTQKNSVLIIGENNFAKQVNDADDPFGWDWNWGGSSTRVPTVKQTQTNIGVLLGKNNNLYQSNTADAAINNGAPEIIQQQKNIAFAVNTCKDCMVDTTYAGTTKVTWPVLEVYKPTVIEVDCPGCELDP